MSVIEAAVPIDLAIPHATWKSFPICKVDRTESLPFSFAKLAFILHPIHKAVIEVEHVRLAVAYLQIE